MEIFSIIGIILLSLNFTLILLYIYLKRCAHQEFYEYPITDGTFKNETRHSFEITFRPFSLTRSIRKKGVGTVWSLQQDL